MTEQPHCNPCSHFLPLQEDSSPEGGVRPLWIVWETGVRYEIDRVLEARQAHSLKNGGTGIRYTVRVRGRVTHLWHEGPRWFVEEKE